MNDLNQYTSRVVPGAVDVFGVGRGTVTVNSQSTYRKGEYFRREVSVTNSSVPVQQAITVTATDGTSTSQSGTNYVPRTPESFGYDRDGNLTNDGRWQFTWDAENRLVQMRTIAGVPTSAERRLEFEYDARSRRIRKRVYNAASGGTLILDNKFLYDGWNLVAELNGTNNAVIRSYVWGTDLSGTMQGAGGVGGLLFVKVGGATHAVGYNGNGNVEGLVDTSTGSSSAQYEYGPFGEVLRMTGTVAKANPFRFSTKYQDDESDFLYYGYRYYSASSGRWLSRDPIEEHGGSNIYATVNNTPVNNLDVLGLIGGWGVGNPIPVPPGWPGWVPGAPPSRRGPGLADQFNPGGIRGDIGEEDYTDWFNFRYPETIAEAKRVMVSRILGRICSNASRKPFMIRDLTDEQSDYDLNLSPAFRSRWRDRPQCWTERHLELGDFDVKADKIRVKNWTWG